MSLTPEFLPVLIQLIADELENNAHDIAALDQAIGDGDHLVNLQRGITSLLAIGTELTELDWPIALKKIGMTLMTAMGGASGSLYGTLFMSMSKALVSQELTAASLAMVFNEGVRGVKQRGKAEAGEKTMLDVLIPVAATLNHGVSNKLLLADLLSNVERIAISGMESTRDMLATKGRASFLEERSIGHIDPGARTCQLIICVIVSFLRIQLLPA